MKYPKVYRIRQIIDTPVVDNIEETVRHELYSIQIHSLIKKGARIPITAGSRGIVNIDTALRQLVHTLLENTPSSEFHSPWPAFHRKRPFSMDISPVGTVDSYKIELCGKVYP